MGNEGGLLAGLALIPLVGLPGTTAGSGDNYPAIATVNSYPQAGGRGHYCAMESANTRRSNLVAAGRLSIASYQDN